MRPARLPIGLLRLATVPALNSVSALEEKCGSPGSDPSLLASTELVVLPDLALPEANQALCVCIDGGW